MKMLILFLAFLLPSAGCIAKESDPTARETKIVFQKKNLQIGTQKISVEIADTQEKSSRGLMYRTELPEGTGMLFIFPDSQVRGFWMKNTFVPLAIGYFNSKKELIDVHEMVPALSEMQKDHPTYVSKGPAQYALEVPTGWFSKHKIQLGQTFKLIDK